MRCLFLKYGLQRWIKVSLGIEEIGMKCSMPGKRSCLLGTKIVWAEGGVFMSNRTEAARTAAPQKGAAQGSL